MSHIAHAPFQPVDRSQTLSPASAHCEWSGMQDYVGNRGISPYSPSSASLGRGDLVTPPDTGYFAGVNQSGHGDYGYSSRALEIPHGRRRPSEAGSMNSSPAVSIANSRSSDGTLSDSNSRKFKRMEYELTQHYNILKSYLRGGPPASQRPNKARDKLLRLSPVQFHELSTDVFDELQRRQALTTLPGRPQPRRDNVPPFLTPRPDFHEKRNQARQKLSSLQSSRFRDLSTDVFCELERRFPHFADPNQRPGARSASRGPGGPSANGFVPPPRTHSHGQSISSQAGRGQPRKVSNSAGQIPHEGAEDYGRPMAKQFQSNTIMPNKSTMVEDVDGNEPNFDRSSDAFGLESALTSPNSNRDTSATSRSGGSSKINNAHMTEMQQRIDELELAKKRQDEELGSLKEKSSSENQDWTELRQHLQNKLDEAERLIQSLRDELDRIHTNHANVERDFESQLEAAKSSGNGGLWREKHEALNEEHRTLQGRLEQQQRVTDEVQQQAREYLHEMRVMADSSGNTFEREERLHNEVQRLEEEVKEWKARFAKTKAQLRHVRASSLGLGIARPDTGNLAKSDSFRDQQGLVKEIHVTKFQISIDELLRTARSGEPSSVLEYMKAVIFAIRNITSDVDNASAVTKDEGSAKRRAKLRAKVSATASNVITACKNYASANGMSPVSLLDAAASHLAAAVVELVRVVKIRPQPPGEVDDDEDETPELLPDGGYFNVAEAMRRHSVAQDSVYSAISTPTDAHGQNESGPTILSRSHSRSASHGGVIGQTNGTANTSSSIMQQDLVQLEHLKNHLENQTEHLVESIQSLVAAIRSEQRLPIIRNYLTYIADVVTDVVSATEECYEEPSSYSRTLKEQTRVITANLTDCKKRLLGAGVESQKLDTFPQAASQVKQFTSELPPLAFEIARETKQLVSCIETIDPSGSADADAEAEDFS